MNKTIRKQNRGCLNIPRNIVITVKYKNSRIRSRLDNAVICLSIISSVHFYAP